MNKTLTERGRGGWPRSRIGATSAKVRRQRAVVSMVLGVGAPNLALSSVDGSPEMGLYVVL